MKLIRTKDGFIQEVPDDYVLKHGETASMSLMFMDGNGGGNHDLHRPGLRYPDDASAQAVDEAYNQGVRDLSEAWRQQGGDDSDDDPPRRTDHRDAAAARDAAYQDYVNRITNAWRSR
jgi:hypothetical protein